MKKLRMGQIGWTVRDEGPEVTTVAMCDINRDKMAGLAKQYPDVRMYTDYKEMVKDPEVDAVAISTPNFVHAEQAIAFLEAGKHVFLEKPMGVDRAECDRIVAAQRRSGKNLTIDFEMRISPFARRIKGLLDGGEFGALRRIEFIHHRGCWLESGNGIWRTRPERSGGLFFMEPIHEVDIFRYFAGEIRAVQSVAGPNVLPQYRFEDNVCSHFFFESGVQGLILTTHTHSAYTTDSALWPNLGHDMNMIFSLTKGSIGVDFIHAKILVNKIEEWPTGSGGARVVAERVEDYTAVNWHAFCHDIDAMRWEFMRRCARGEPPVQDPLDAWRSHMVCLAAEQSVKEDGRRVPVDYTPPQGVPAV